MDASNSDIEIQSWLLGLEGAESKRHESVARAIAKNPTYDARIVFALKRITRQDPQAYARDAAKKALEEIAKQHFAAGNDIRTYLEQLRMNPYLASDAPRTAKSAENIVAPPPAQSIPTPPDAEPHPMVAAPRNVNPVQATPQTVADEPHLMAAAPALPATPPAPPVPFDQWLLSERNIKFALYSGGFLLLLAGLIFVGVNWQYLPGIAKLAVTLAVTAAMYVGGVLLFRRPILKVGGTALLAIASGFLPLNFVVTQLYLLDRSGISFETQWLVASVVCGGVYAVTALRTRHALFSVFMAVAMVAGTTMALGVLRVSGEWAVLGYALMTSGIMGLAYSSATNPSTAFQARVLRIFAHVFVVLVSISVFTYQSILLNGTSRVPSWVALGALALMGALYVADDWRKKSLYARSGAALVFAALTLGICAQLHLSTIQTGVVLKIVAAVYLLVGKLLQRDAAVKAGLPLYVVGAGLALIVTAQALAVLGRTPEHLGLAVAADVVLLALCAYLFRRVEFVYGAVAAALVPVWVFGNLFLQNSLQRALAFGVVMLVYSGVGLRLGPKQVQWALPFLLGAAGLSVLVPALLYPELGVIAAVLVGIAALYAVTAVRFNQTVLVFPALAAVNFAILSAVRFVMPFDVELARVLVWAFCAWAVILFFARRGLLYVRLNEWALPLLSGAVFNFGLTYLLLGFVAVSDVARFGFVSQTAVLTLLGGVGLLALTYWLYRRVEFLYAAVLLAIAPAYLQARLVLGDATRVGLVLGGMLLAYVVIAVVLGYARPMQARQRGAAGAFWAGAVVLSIVVIGVLYPNYAVLTAMLVGIAALYAFAAVWVQQRWLTLASIAALDFAVFSGVRSAFQFVGEIQEMSALGLGIIGVGLTLAAVWFKLRGWQGWRVPLYAGAGFNLLIAFMLGLTRESLFSVGIALVVATVCFVMQWVERDALDKLKVTPVLSYIGASIVLIATYLAAQVAGLEIAYRYVATVLAAVALVGASLYLFIAVPDAVLKRLYEKPLWSVGVVGMVGVLLLLVPTQNNLAAAIAFALAAVAFGLQAWVRKNVWFAYAGGASAVVAWWWSLRYFQVRELQAFIIPLGVLVLVIGWNELRMGRRLGFQLATVAGLVLLLGSAFYQSLGSVNYAMLLLVESVVSFGVGVRMRSRFYVEAAMLALVGNGLVQFGPALIDLPRWVQIGAIGSILVTGGLFALFRRQRLLEMRSAFTDGWKRWQP